MDFESLLKKGIAVDLLDTERHFYIYRMLGENHIEINKKEQSHQKQSLSYLQNASQELAILNLSRVFDRKKKRYNVRCIDFIIDQCLNIDTINFPLNVEYYPDLKKISKITQVDLTYDTIETNEDLIHFIKESLESANTKSPVKKLHTIRDKYIAHNEHLPEDITIESFWDDFQLLLNLGKLYLSAIGQIFANESFIFTIESEPGQFSSEVLQNTGWISEILIEFLGKDKVKFI